MDPADVPGLRAMISEPRFSRYLEQSDNDERAALRLYVWNIEITSAFWGPISVFEILLRNAIHNEMKVGRSDNWWDSVYLAPKEDASLARTIQKLTEDLGEGDTPAPDDVIGATNLGLWVGLTGPGQVKNPVTDYESKIWQPRVQKAFPNLGSVRRKQLHVELQRLRAFRNRLAHHEAVFNSPHSEMRDLIITIVGYMNADIAPFISDIDRIDMAIARRAVAVDTGVCVI